MGSIKYFLGCSSPEGFHSFFGELCPTHSGGYTYIIKGAPHVSASYGTDYSNFFLWLATCDGDFYAGVNEDYPQFMLSGVDQHLSKWAS